jgi:hypothetical protein
MKPTSHVAPATERDGKSQIATKQFPAIDFHFQSIALDGYRGAYADTDACSFRNISRDYFEKEAPHIFAGEAAFFAMIILTAALPVLNSIHALADFVRAIGAL